MNLLSSFLLIFLKQPPVFEQKTEVTCEEKPIGRSEALRLARTKQIKNRYKNAQHD